VAVVALVNAIRMSVMATRYYGCEFVCPWYAVGLTGISWPPTSIWSFAPTRLLVAALCLRARTVWMDGIALLFTIQIVLGNLLFALNPDTMRWDLERGPTPLDTPAAQALLAAVIAGIALHRIARLVGGGRIGRRLLLTGGAAVAVLVVGYASDFASHAAADRDTARYVSEVVLGRRPFYVLTDRDPVVFRDVRAPAQKGDTSQTPYVSIFPTMFVAPFVLEANWDYYNGAKDNRNGSALIAGFFGSTVVLRRGEPGESPLAWRFLIVLYPG
jgi:hypothetical protein